ncbi:MAG: thiamine phosphate synthase [Eubacterium sp.]|nr:thiamine phosphate synthase [Eubacterium sp.]
MYKISSGDGIPCLCVTNRKLCQGDFYERIWQIVQNREANAILLREKDLSRSEYENMAEKVLRICQEADMMCILHTFWESALKLHCHNIHLPLGVLETLPDGKRNYFQWIGSSVHSLEQAKRAEESGADYVIAGHVFETDCKKGLPGRGLEFIQKVSGCIHIPVYGIGGICQENAEAVVQAGAAGVCVMSGFMTIRQ